MKMVRSSFSSSTATDTAGLPRGHVIAHCSDIHLHDGGRLSGAERELDQRHERQQKGIGGVGSVEDHHRPDSRLVHAVHRHVRRVAAAQRRAIRLDI